MYKLEIIQPGETWIAAISPDRHRIDKYLHGLSEEIQAQSSCDRISPQAFPLILLEYSEPSPETGSRFEFCTLEALQERIDLQRRQRTDNEEHVYFRYYFFDEDYFQAAPNENYMHYLPHTAVTNLVLDEPYPISVFHEKIKQYASGYDINSLDALFEQTQIIHTSLPEKENLALNGYDRLFWDMNYDHACGKLTDAGIEYLLPMVDKMEILLGEKKWQHRSYALHIVLEKACKEKNDSVVSLLQGTIHAFENYLLTHPEEKPDIHRLLAQAFQWMMEADCQNALRYWNRAMAEMQKVVKHAPEKASWFSILELIYASPVNDENIKAAQAEAQKNFITETGTLEKKLGGMLAYRIAQAYQQLREHWEWKKPEEAFPEEEARSWAEKSLAYQPREISRMDLHECAQFYHRTGSAERRIEFLEKTITLYERVLAATSDCVFEVYYIAGLWKEIAEIHIESNSLSLADEAMVKAQQIYDRYQQTIRLNPSTFLHYAEFLEYCFFSYPGNINKPSLAVLNNIACEVEIQSEGFLSYPYLLLMKIALHENNEAQAVLELTKSLILHELCAESVYEDLWKNFKDSNYRQLSAFLYDTIQFIGEIRENYYYHPGLRWKQLCTMTAGELTGYWEKRKKELRNRSVTDSE